jgi:hypothetical protein
MKTNTNSKYLIAVLIDGDNVSFERMEDIMGFVSRYGDAVIRRIYGDWMEKPLNFDPFGHARFAHLFVLYD